jgi:hypothetical protein
VASWKFQEPEGQISLGVALGIVQPVNVERRSFLKHSESISTAVFPLRHSSHCLASGKLSGPPGPFQCLSCLGAMFIHFW